MFRGEESDEAVAAALRFHEFQEWSIAYIKAKAKAK
jgi:hypothetical protein